MTTERDPGRPIAYEALAVGTPVHDQQGQPVGTVKQILAVEEEDVFDGLVIETGRGTRFIDAPEVSAIAEHRVDLKLTGSEVAARPEHEQAGRTFEARVPSGRFQDLWRRVKLRRLWRGD